MAETKRPECVRLWKEYIELILFRGAIFIWSPIAFATSCLILAVVNGGLIYSNNLLFQYINGGCRSALGLSGLRSDTQAVAAFIVAIAFLAMVAEVVILIIRAGQFGIRIKEINKYLTVLLIVDVALTPFFALCYLIGGAIMARRAGLWATIINSGILRFCSGFPFINPTDDSIFANDATVDARVLYIAMAINAAASMICMAAFILLGIWMAVILGWKLYQKKYGGGDDAEMEAK